MDSTELAYFKEKLEAMSQNLLNEAEKTLSEVQRQLADIVASL